jgi:hypothetical protein
MHCMSVSLLADEIEDGGAAAAAEGNGDAEGMARVCHVLCIVMPKMRSSQRQSASHGPAMTAPGINTKVAEV